MTRKIPHVVLRCVVLFAAGAALGCLFGSQWLAAAFTTAAGWLFQ